MSTEEDIVGICCQAMTDEDIANRIIKAGCSKKLSV
jgi:hypothetical protein